MRTYFPIHFKGKWVSNILCILENPSISTIHVTSTIKRPMPSGGSGQPSTIACPFIHHSTLCLPGPGPKYWPTRSPAAPCALLISACWQVLLWPFSAAQVKQELKAQVELFHELTGHLPPHMDGHQHIHVLPGKNGVLFFPAPSRWESRRVSSDGMVPCLGNKPHRKILALQLQFEHSHLGPGKTVLPQPKLAAWFL